MYIYHDFMEKKILAINNKKILQELVLLISLLIFILAFVMI